MKIKTEKVCTICKTLKPISDYYFTSRGAVKYAKSECKRCTLDRNKSKMEYKKASAERRKTPEYIAYQRAYYHQNKEIYKKSRQQFAANNPDYWKVIWQKKKAQQHAVKAALLDADLE